jgi:alkanesulfonate monooxygenase
VAQQPHALGCPGHFHTQTAAIRLWVYRALGVRTVIASGYPYLEEAYRVAEPLFPALGIRRRRFEPGRDFGAAAAKIAAA